MVIWVVVEGKHLMCPSHSTACSSSPQGSNDLPLSSSPLPLSLHYCHINVIYQSLLLLTPLRHALTPLPTFQYYPPPLYYPLPTPLLILLLPFIFSPPPFSAFDCAEQRFVLYTPPKALASDGQDEPTAPSPSPAHAHAHAPSSPTLMSTLQGTTTPQLAPPPPHHPYLSLPSHWSQPSITSPFCPLSSLQGVADVFRTSFLSLLFISPFLFLTPLSYLSPRRLYPSHLLVSITIVSHIVHCPLSGCTGVADVFLISNPLSLVSYTSIH